jgi:hypothetical protein
VLLTVSGDELVVVLHGLGGSTESRYMPRAARAALRANISVLLLNARGAGAEDLGVAHAGLIEDLAACLAAPALASYRRIYLLGYSMGGHVALYYASADPDARLRSVAVACSPLDLTAGMRAFDKPRFSVYRRHVLGALVAGYERWAERGDVPVDVTQVRGIKRIKQWDERVVVPAFGFSSVWDYYDAACVKPRLAQLKVPCLYVGAWDDPMVPFHSVHSALASKPPLLTVHWSKVGGHLAFPGTLSLSVAGEPGFENQALAWLRLHAC